MKFSSYYGVDFSGAKEAGRNTWVAHAQRGGKGRLELVELSSLEKLCGCASRDEALKHLVNTIAASQRALWSLDMPFGLPIEIFDVGMTWPRQLEHVRDFAGDAYDLGLWCCEQGKRLGGPMHIRRTTDTDTKTPFDCYHYRIVYQTYHGMRDVLAPLAGTRGTAVLPFHYPRLKSAKRVVLETCPASTLKRWGVPHQKYKQPGGGKLTAIRLRTRRAILAALARHVDISDPHRRIMMRNGGGDAIDAVIALLGGREAFHAADHRAIARHPRYRLEGHLFA